MRASIIKWSSKRASSLPTTVKQLLASAPRNEVNVSGWIKSIRQQKRVAFAELTDGSTSDSLQVVLDPQDAASLSTGCSVFFSGTLKASLGAGQSVELKADKVSLLGACDESYPIQKKAHSTQFLRKIPHLRPRTESITSMLRYRHQAREAVSSYLAANEFTQVEPPILTSSDCEGGSSVFRVESSSSFPSPPIPTEVSEQTRAPTLSKPFFPTPTYLTVSSQLYLESLSAALGRVWALSPAFRAERSLTSRHLTEFYMLECELSFCDLDQVMDVVEGLVRAAGEIVGKEMGEWSRIEYGQAVKMLKAKGEMIEWGEDIKTEQEKLLCDIMGGPVFVGRYPKKSKPFYMRAVEGREEVVECFDLLVPRIGELAGGSMREERMEELVRNMEDKGLKKEEYEWYLDLRRYGSVPHGGFGLGWERLISWMTEAENVRECIAFPRGTEGFKI